MSKLKQGAACLWVAKASLEPLSDLQWGAGSHSAALCPQLPSFKPTSVLTTFFISFYFLCFLYFMLFSHLAGERLLLPGLADSWK